MMAQLGSGLWQRLETPSLERFTLESRAGGFTLNGTVVLELDSQPASVAYTIQTDTTWLTRAVSVVLHWGQQERKLELRIDDDQRWWQGDRELSALMGRCDVDLSVTPATNTLPIRRLNLNIGESAEVTAAWVKFPGLELEPLPQRYTRLSEDRYRYESGTALADFSADLRVDGKGVVTDYLHGGNQGWIRVPRSSAS